MIIETNSHIGTASAQLPYQCLYKWSCEENQQASDLKHFRRRGREGQRIICGSHTQPNMKIPISINI